LKSTVNGFCGNWSELRIVLPICEWNYNFGNLLDSYGSFE